MVCSVLGGEVTHGTLPVLASAFVGGGSGFKEPLDSDLRSAPKLE